MKYNCPEKQAIACVESGISAEHWDKLWETDKLSQIIHKGAPFVIKHTRKYLPAGARILEGGCGQGAKVYALKQKGYEAVGLDFAKKTIAAVRKEVPDLEIIEGDVRKLPFNNNSFDGYWSLGVIEHFWDGYSEILDEAARVVKQDGYLFLTVPALCPLRKLKRKLGYYPCWDKPQMPDGFYQFYLPREKVQADVRARGFNICYSTGYDAVKCLKDDIPLFAPFLQKVYDGSGIWRLIRGILQRTMPLFAHHMMFIVAKKS